MRVVTLMAKAVVHDHVVAHSVSDRSAQRRRPRLTFRSLLGESRGFSLMELMITLGIMGTITAIALPPMSSTLANLRLSGDARSVSNAISVVKLRSASDFTQVRLYANLS